MYNTLMSSKQKLHSDEQGFAAIIIAIILILVLSLTTVGFATLMRSEEKSALEKHLSSQAYYAAEAGINDAAKAINAGFDQRKTTCAPLASSGLPGSQYLTDNKVDSGGDVSYTCLLIDPVPPSLEYQSIDDAESKAIIVTGVNKDDTTDVEPLGSLYIGWEDKSGSSDFAPSSVSFKPAAESADNWSYTNVLRINITPLAKFGVTRDLLRQSNFAAFLYPNAGAAPATTDYNTGIAGTNNANIGNVGQILKGNCRPAVTTDYPRKCGVVITGLTQSDYLVTLQSIYPDKPLRVTIKAKAFNGTTLRIKNGQILVDSTGKAQDVLKRIQVRIPAHNGYPHTDYGLESMSSICKQWQLTPTSDIQGSCSSAP
jgi:hypothetical protein